MFKNTIFSLLISIFLFFSSLSQKNNFIVVLKDKSGSSLNFESQFSKKSLEKRKKENILFDKYDIPVSKKYISALSQENKVFSPSKWLNSCLIKSNFSASEIKKRYHFVKQVIPISQKKRKDIPLLGNAGRAADPNLYNYTYNQLEATLTASCLHDNGYKGQGILIAVLDAGFPEMDSMLAFENLRANGRIIDTWDFEDDTSFVFYKHSHGTSVSSIITGELDSTYIGSAPEADFAFYITEITSVEINQEEYNLVLALERADSIGADIASISLGYRNFDTLQISYGYTGMDGQTTIVSQGAKVARNKGIIVVSSAGNSGNDGVGSLVSPCDTDSILCVGAINYDSTRATFSSEGPSYDGRIKPDVTNIGDSCYYIGTDDTVRYGNGTSFSCPLTSGLAACLKQAHPNRTNFEIMDAIRQGASNATSPDNIFGWGIPNSCRIDSILTVIDSLYAGTTEHEQILNVRIFPNPATDIISIESNNILNQIIITDFSGKIIKQINFQTFQSLRKLNVSELSSGNYLITIKDVNNLTTSSLFKKM